MMSDTARLRRERWIVATVITFLVVLRSVVFVFWEQSFFDSDQAITGLMAKHLSEGRAFPLFYYAQNYMLAVEAWITAPIFFVAGASNAGLKLPMVAINIAVALLLLRTLEREVGLRPALAMVPVLCFALPAPGTAAFFMHTNGGSIEPFLYVILIWLTRKRPAWCGLIIGIGVLHRDFTLYGVAALLTIGILQRTLFTREGVRHHLVMLRTTAEVWLVAQWLKVYSSAAGPGTTIEDVYHRDGLGELLIRTCIDIGTIPIGAWRLFARHWPMLFGVQPQPLYQFGIESPTSQGAPGAWLVLVAVVAIPTAVIAARLITDRSWKAEYSFPAYLILIGLFSAFGYAVAKCGEVSIILMRYDLLSVLGLVGLGAWFLAIAQSRGLRAVWIGGTVSLTVLALVAHISLLRKYIVNAPVGTKQLIIQYLDSRGIKYASADYWTAYPVSFLSNERIIVASTEVVRIKEYQRIVAEHHSESVLISRTACDGGSRLLPGLYVCPP